MSLKTECSTFCCDASYKSIDLSKSPLFVEPSLPLLNKRRKLPLPPLQKEAKKSIRNPIPIDEKFLQSLMEGKSREEVIIFLETHYKRRDDLVAAFSICVKIAPKMFFPNIGREFHSGKIGKSPSEFAVIGDRIHRKRFLPVPLDITNPFTSR